MIYYNLASYHFKQFEIIVRQLPYCCMRLIAINWLVYDPNLSPTFLCYFLSSFYL